MFSNKRYLHGFTVNTNLYREGWAEGIDDKLEDVGKFIERYEGLNSDTKKWIGDYFVKVFFDFF